MISSEIESARYEVNKHQIIVCFEKLFLNFYQSLSIGSKFKSFRVGTWSGSTGTRIPTKQWEAVGFRRETELKRVLQRFGGVATKVADGVGNLIHSSAVSVSPQPHLMAAS